MKQSSTLIPTLRDVPSEIEAKSHEMLLRAGFIRESTSGVFSYLPLAKRILNKIEKMIHLEMESFGAVEISLPTLQAQEVMEQSSNYVVLRDELLHIKKGSKQKLILAPTHEEAMKALIREEIQSFKSFPITLYQIQTNYRNETQPNYGLLRSKEFMMKDAYSFHASKESQDLAFNEMLQVYSNIFSKLGLHYEIIEANPGLGKDAKAKEFVVSSELGESTVVYSDESKYLGNIKVAPVIGEFVPSTSDTKALEKVATPNLNTLDEVCTFFNIEEKDCIKSELFKVDGEYVVVLVRGDHNINPYKLKNVLQATSIHVAKDQDVQELLGAHVGLIGPIKLPIDVKVVADNAIQSIGSGVTGANEAGYHYINVCPGRDFAISIYDDIRYIQEGDPSPDGQGTILFKKAIEVGKISKLDESVADFANENLIADNEQAQALLMNSYHLGISRLLAIIAENFQDEKGFVWPKQFSPYELHLIPVDEEDEIQFNLATELYNILTFYQFEVLFDDRHTEPEVKFTDADLIGLPVRITVGRRASEGIVEVKIRKTGETFEWAKEELIDHLNEIFRSH
ncbi:proline--tRNA ligase [Ureibacillus sinduriensis]|uniref:Proline--tRNA ligase n=1 Tax=Ureibacillus sinduriensis BLB-1 = JCM 15800 TaxID=1384057 RepID=A0A0A3HNH4_9BACL|nr:proline--tRNA ligase [Ureibacillus sinduriensis]KGR73929.1 prolyl-tRNA synthetase [Ureibacillus sinduriensis BLB-1 = JCM 15800]